MAKHVIQVLLYDGEERSIDADSLTVDPDGALRLHLDGDQTPPRTIAHFVHGTWCGYQVTDPPDAYVGYDEDGSIGDTGTPSTPYSLGEAVNTLRRACEEVAAAYGLR